MDHKYPYTDFHELNLDWFLSEFKKLTAEWLQMQQGWEDEQQAFQDLKDYVNSYFVNLDVQEEINNKLDGMALNGQLGTIMSPYVTAELPSVVAAQLAPVVADQITAVVASILPLVIGDQLATLAPPIIADWLTDHIDPATGYVIDNTLTVQNAAADAKTTGDKIAEVNSKIQDLDMIQDQNLIVLTGGSQSARGVDVETTPEGYLKFNGTATGTTIFTLMGASSQSENVITPGTYYYNRILISGTVGSTNPSVRYYTSTTAIPGLITIDSDSPLYIRVATGSSFTDAIYAFTFVKIDKAVPYFNKITAKDEIARGWVEDLQAAQNAYISMYEKIAVCGASWDSGYYYIDSTTHENSKLSWLANLARKNGVTPSVFARHSLYTRTWLTSAYGLSAMQNADPQNLYILTFGGNDSEQDQSYLGSINDITDYTSYVSYPDTFYGNYGKIIEQILEKSPKAQIIMIMFYNITQPAIRKTYFDAAAEIATHYGLPFLNWNDDPWYASDVLLGNLVGNHPTPVQLSGIAGAFERLFSKAAVTYYSYFKTYDP